jgi:cytidylate kinase
MGEKSSAQRLAEAIVLAGGYGRPHGLPARGRAFTIALSREVGAGGTSVASEVGARLNWPVYDHELIERIAREMNLRTALLESVDERRLSWVEECLESLSSLGRPLSENAFVRHLVQTILSLGAHGECIIVGRGAAQVLPAESTLRIRLVAHLEDRVAAIMNERRLGRDEARRWLEVTERERQQFVQDHFHRDPADPREYDLVLNTSRLGYGGSAELIIEALHRLSARQPQPRPALAPA